MTPLWCRGRMWHERHPGRVQRPTGRVPSEPGTDPLTTPQQTTIERCSAMPSCKDHSTEPNVQYSRVSFVCVCVCVYIYIYMYI
jgi:hypothetical protein